MSSPYGSPTSTGGGFTDLQDSVLCLVCTPNATGAQLIATLNVRLRSTLAEVRGVLSSLARGEDGGPSAVAAPPVNVNAAQAKELLAAPLHPFDLTSAFSFVIGGGCVAIEPAVEARVRVEEVIPCYPRFGPPASSAWHLQPPAPTVSLPLRQFKQANRKKKKGIKHGSDKRRRESSLSAATQVVFSNSSRRVGVMVLYVAQGSPPKPERVLAERLQLQQAATYGRHFDLQLYTNSVTRWNANVRDFIGRTLLQEAALEGIEPAVRFLCGKSYVQQQATDREGNTALHLAVMGGHEGCAKMLLEAGASVLQPNQRNNTPLHLALLKGRRGAALVGLLCGQLRSSAGGAEAGRALLALRNSDGYNPLDLFQRNSPSLMELCVSGSLSAVKALVHHCLFNKDEIARRQVYSHQTIIHAAAHGGNAEVLRYLIQDLDLCNKERGPWRQQLLDARWQTPLHLAAAGGHVRCVAYLMERFPRDLAQQDLNGDTPLLLALKRRQLAVAEHLLLHSAPGSIAADAQDHNGMAALHLLCGLGMAKAAAALLKQHGASVNLSSSTVDHAVRLWGDGQFRNMKLVKRETPYKGRPTLRLAERLRARSSVAVATTSLRCEAAASYAPCMASFEAGGGMRGYTPLLCALIAGRRYYVVELLETLLRHGAGDSAEDIRDLLFYALTRRYFDLAEKVLQTGQLNAGSKEVLDQVRADNVLWCRLIRANFVNGDDANSGSSSSSGGGSSRGHLHLGGGSSSRGVASGSLPYLASSSVRTQEAAVQWCVEHKYGRLNSCLGGNPLGMAALVGDAATVTYLLSLGADPNLRLPPSLFKGIPTERELDFHARANASRAQESEEGASRCCALACALSQRHEAIVPLLLQGGARLTSSAASSTSALANSNISRLDASMNGGAGEAGAPWSALTAAVQLQLEGVVSGLLGLAVSTPELIARTLLSTLLSLPSYRASSPHMVRLSRLCVLLARHVDPTNCIVHVTEVMHFAAHCQLFEVVRALAEVCAALPSGTWEQLLHQLPPPPLERPQETIEPTMVPCEDYITKKCPRLLPSAVNGKGGLCRPPKPFRRLVLPNWRRARLLKQELFHRLTLRDVYSYAVEAGEMELVVQLQQQLSLPMWSVTDMRGNNVADYALRGGCVALVLLTAAAGITPRRRHGDRVAACVSTGALVRGLHDSQQQLEQQRAAAGDGTLTTATTTSNAIADEFSTASPRQYLFGATDAVQERSLRVFTHIACSLIREAGTTATSPPEQAMLSQLLCDLVNAHLAQNGASDLEGAGIWLDEVLQACVACRRLPFLRLLVEQYRCSLVTTNHKAPRHTARFLLTAVYTNDSDMLSYLLRAGCLPHRGGTPTLEMASRVGVKNAEHMELTPACLAAWMGRLDLLQLLCAAARFEPVNCKDQKDRNADVIKALIRGARGVVTAERDALLAGAVVDLASAGHPFLSPHVLRLAARKGLARTVTALTEFYGERALLADLVPDEINSLHYLAARPDLCPVLRSLFVQSETDEFGMEHVRLTNLAATVLEKMQKAKVETPARYAIGVVDYVLSRGCTEGAVLLLALGLPGEGCAAFACQPSSLAASLRAVLRHHSERRDRYAAGTYSVLHSAVELNYSEVARALMAEMKLLPRVAAKGSVLLSPSASVAQGDSVPATARRLAPSVYALAALHADNSGLAARLEEAAAATAATSRLRATDFLAFTFNHLRITRSLDLLCRRTENARIFGEMFTLCDADAWPPSFLSRQFARHATELRVSGTRYVLTSCTSLACAVASGSLEWVQYLAFCQPSMPQHRASFTRRVTEHERAAVASDDGNTSPTAAKRQREARQRFRGGVFRNKKPQHRRHQCHAITEAGPMPLLAPEVCTVDVVLMAASYFGTACLSANVSRITTYAAVLQFLFSLPGSLRRDNVNLVAIVLARVRRWDLLQLLIASATKQFARAQDAGADDEDDGADQQSPRQKGRFFFPVLNEEVPAILAPIVGAARHVMHAAAAAADKDVLIEIARHCHREHIEAACDARGHTSVYHALHHPHAHALETFSTLRIPFGPSCTKREGRTALMVAAALGRLPFVSALLKPEQMDKQDRQGHTALMLAAQHGHLDVVELLLASGADPSLRNHRDMTAVMLAAQAGHDHVAAPMVRHFSQSEYLVGAQTTLLHCAAMGGCAQAAEVAIKALRSAAEVLHEDADGHTAVYLAYGYGRAKVLRLLLAALYKGQAEGTVSAGLDELGAAGETERRLFRCDANLENYGWLQGVLQVNERVAEELRQRYRRGERNHSSGSGAAAAVHNYAEGLLYAPRLRPLRKETSCLLWCAKTNNAVGVRVLADLNIADTCDALHAAAARGHMDVLKLLVTLRMSDPNAQSADGGLYAFEEAALRGFEGCATYLLTHTRPDPSFLLDTNGGGGGGGARHSILHRLAPVCGGAVVVQLVEKLVQAGNGAAVLCQKLAEELQRPDDVGLTPFEYTIAMGNPAAVLRVAQLLQQLNDTAGSASGKSANSISISNALFQYLPTLSPAVRTLLFDFFQVTAVMHAIGFSPDVDLVSNAAISGHSPPPPSSASSTVTSGGEGGRFFSPDKMRVDQHSVRRLRFGDVRLLGIHVLQKDAFCAPLVSQLFSQERERQVLRLLLKGFPFRIRYNPDGFRQCTLAQQLQLLQYLGSSLILSVYDNCSLKDMSAVEISVVQRRSEEFMQHQSSSQVAHSVYISGNGYVAVPDVASSVRSAHRAYRNYLRSEVEGLSRRASSLMQALPHPALRGGSVTVEWAVMDLPRGGPTVQEDRRYWESTFHRLRNGMHRLMDLLRYNLRDALQETAEADLTSIVSEVRRAQPALVKFTFVDDATLTRFPPPPSLNAEVPCCTLFFNMDEMTDVTYVAERTLCRAIEADIALVRVHRARDLFVKQMHSTLLRAKRLSLAAARRSSTAAAAAAAPIAEEDLHPIRFKLELENRSLEDMSLIVLKRLLNATREVVGAFCLQRVVPRADKDKTTNGGEASATPTKKQQKQASASAAAAGERSDALQLPSPAHAVKRFHSQYILQEAIVRRMRGVLVLYTTKRDALVKFSGDKLMLCFTPGGAPSKAEIAAAIRETLVEDEIQACKRVLQNDVLPAMSQRLATYLPAASLRVDWASIEGPATAPHDREFVLSSLRLLTHGHSMHVLQPFVDGVSIGWDAPLGKFIRDGVQELVVQLDLSGEHGTCHYAPAARRLTYYCPLECVERGAYLQRAWQLLSAQQVASCLLLQLAVEHPALQKLVDTRRCFPAWSEVFAGTATTVDAGATKLILHIHTRNILNRFVAARGIQFKFVGAVRHVRVREEMPTPDPSQPPRAKPRKEGGHYVVEYAAPTRAGHHRLYILTQGQQLLQSPLWLTVTAAPAVLDKTRLLTAYTAAVAKVPFTLQLGLFDAYENPVTVRALRAVEVALTWSSKTAGVQLLACRPAGGNCLELLLVITRENADAGISLQLTSTDDPEERHELDVPIRGASMRTYEALLALRRGLPLEVLEEHHRVITRRRRRAERQRQRQQAQAPTPALGTPQELAEAREREKEAEEATDLATSMSATSRREMNQGARWDRAKYYFRVNVRNAEKERVERDSKQLGEWDLTSTVFAPQKALPAPAAEKKDKKKKKKKSKQEEEEVGNVVGATRATPTEA